MPEENQENQTPAQESSETSNGQELTPEERRKRINAILEKMISEGKIPPSLLVGVTAKKVKTPEEQLEEDKQSEHNFQLYVEQILEEKEGQLGKLDDEGKKYVMPEVIKDVLKKNPISNEEMRQAAYESLKKRGVEYLEHKSKHLSTCEMPRPDILPAGIDWYTFVHTQLNHNELMDALSGISPDEALSARARIAHESLNAIKSGNPRTEEAAQQIVQAKILEGLREYSDLLGQIIAKRAETDAERKKIIEQVTKNKLADYIAITEPPKKPIQETKKEEAVRKYSGRTMAKIAGGVAAALMLAGGIWLFTRGKESGLENIVETQITQIAEKPSDYVEPAKIETTEKPADTYAPVEPKIEKIEIEFNDIPSLLEVNDQAREHMETKTTEPYLSGIPQEHIKVEIVLTPTETPYIETAQPLTPEQTTEAAQITTPEQAPDVILPVQPVQKEILTEIPKHAEILAIVPYVGMKVPLHSVKNIGHCPVFGLYINKPDKKIFTCAGIEYLHTKDAVSDSDFDVELKSAQYTGKIGMKYNLADENNFRVSAGLAAKFIYEDNVMNVHTGGTTTSSRCHQTLFGLEGAVDICYGLGRDWNLFVEGAIGKNFGHDVNTDLETLVRVGLTKSLR